MLAARTERKEEKVIQELLKILEEVNTPEIKTLVVHRFSDDDCWLCLWMAKKFILKTAGAEIVFVNAGESLPESNGDPSVLHFDTGGGELDQHGKGLKTSSATILAEKLGLKEDPGLKALLEMVEAVDNVKPLPPTSIHYTIEGLPRHLKYKKEDGTIDWDKVKEHVFELFDIVYGQETQRAQSRNMLHDHAEITRLPNGIKVASLFWCPELRDAAYEEGIHVVVWTISKGKGKFYFGIQLNQNFRKLRLGLVAIRLREAEAEARGIDINGKNMGYIGDKGPINNIFLHDSGNLILSGSRSRKLTEEEFTKLQPRQIVSIALSALRDIPFSQVQE